MLFQNKYFLALQNIFLVYIFIYICIYLWCKKTFYEIKKNGDVIIVK